MPSPGPGKPLCSARRTNGDPCKLPPIRGGNVCHKHGGSAPQVRAAANRRLSASLDALMAALLTIALDESQPVAARLVAIKDGLDRAGVGKDHPVTVQIKPWERDIEGLLVDVDLPDVVDAEVVEDRAPALLASLPSAVVDPADRVPRTAQTWIGRQSYES